MLQTVKFKYEWRWSFKNISLNQDQVPLVFCRSQAVRCLDRECQVLCLQAECDSVDSDDSAEKNRQC